MGSACMRVASGFVPKHGEFCALHIVKCSYNEYVLGLAMRMQNMQIMRIAEYADAD